MSNIFKSDNTNNKSDSCGTCCCTPGSTECSSINSALSCLADKGSCSGNDRGLCCGCSSDGDCSAGRVPNPNTGCGLDSCCDSRPKLDDNNAVKAADDLNRLTPEPDSTTVCRNTIIKVPFDSQMDPKSFNSNNFLLLERVASTSDCKFGTTSFLVFDNEINGGNIFQKIYNYLLSLIKKVVHIFAVVWGENSPALASIIDVAPSLYCSIPGVFSVDQTPTTSALIFRPTNFLDADVDYFAVVLGQKNLLNLASSTPGGVISFKGIGFAGSHLGNHTSVDIALMPNADNNSALDACSVYGCNALKDCAGNKCYFDTNLKKCVLGGVDTPKTCSEDADCSNGNFACQIASGQTCGQPVKYYGGPYNSDGSQRDQSGYYRTVKIGSQCWFKDNLNTGAMINSSVSQTASSDISKYCYDNNSDYCTTDGGLYQWDEAMQGTTTAGTQGICPDGWHVPTDAEQNTLDQGLTDSGSTCDPKRNTWGCGAAGDKLKAGGSSGFDGGFTGYYNPLSSCFVHSPNNIFIWSSTADSGDASSAWDRIAVPATATGTIRFNNDKGTALSIRCIQNPSPSIGVCAAKTVLPACEAATASRTVVNSYVWKFKTLPPSSTNGGVCAVDHLVVTPVAHLFNKNTNDLNENDTDATNKTFDTVADRDRVYTGQAVSSNGQILNPVNGYSWNWNFKVGDTRFITTSTVSGLDYNKTLVSVVPGVPEALTTLTGSLNMDAGNRFNVGSGMSTMVPVRIFICNSPWPIFSNPDNWQPFKDNNNLTCVDGKNCSNYNYEFYYCRDGADTSTPDLPALITAPVNHGTASRHVCSNDINKECPNGNSDCSGDGVCVTELLKDSYFFRAP